MQYISQILLFKAFLKLEHCRPLWTNRQKNAILHSHDKKRKKDS